MPHVIFVFIFWCSLKTWKCCVRSVIHGEFLPNHMYFSAHSSYLNLLHFLKVYMVERVTVAGDSPCVNMAEFRPTYSTALIVKILGFLGWSIIFCQRPFNMFYYYCSVERRHFLLYGSLNAQGSVWDFVNVGYLFVVLRYAFLPGSLYA